MARRRRLAGNGLDAWPGYVDALSTLLMVIIFVLLVFVLAQAFLSVNLSGRTAALERLTRQMAAISDSLALERAHDKTLTAANATLSRQADEAAAARDTLITRLDEARGAAASLTAERDAARADSAATNARLADTSAAAAALQARLADLAAHPDPRLASLAAERDSATRLGAEQQAQLDLLNRQMEQARAQLAALATALDAAKTDASSKDARIADLDARLNTALASKVLELQRYRSEFFGRLRDLLANEPGVQVVGDRFVFQSEVLFPPGSAELTASGREQVRRLASTIERLEPSIPGDLNWVLRVDGHADRQPIADRRFASNWELSAQRAINVVKLLNEDGLPANRLAAAGFGDNQPLDQARNEVAYARNRRIEIRLTDR